MLSNRSSSIRVAPAEWRAKLIPSGVTVGPSGVRAGRAGGCGSRACHGGASAALPWVAWGLGVGTVIRRGRRPAILAGEGRAVRGELRGCSTGSARAIVIPSRRPTRSTARPWLGVCNRASIGGRDRSRPARDPRPETRENHGRRHPRQGYPTDRPPAHGRGPIAGRGPVRGRGPRRRRIAPAAAGRPIGSRSTGGSGSTTSPASSTTSPTSASPTATSPPTSAPGPAARTATTSSTTAGSTPRSATTGPRPAPRRAQGAGDGPGARHRAEPHGGRRRSTRSGSTSSRSARSRRTARFFDIDWSPVKDDARRPRPPADPRRPVRQGPRSRASSCSERDGGGFLVRYHDRRCRWRPRSYATVLERRSSTSCRELRRRRRRRPGIPEHRAPRPGPARSRIGPTRASVEQVASREGGHQAADRPALRARARGSAAFLDENVAVVPGHAGRARELRRAPRAPGRAGLPARLLAGRVRGDQLPPVLRRQRPGRPPDRGPARLRARPRADLPLGRARGA